MISSAVGHRSRSPSSPLTDSSLQDRKEKYPVVDSKWIVRVSISSPVLLSPNPQTNINPARHTLFTTQVVALVELFKQIDTCQYVDSVSRGTIEHQRAHRALVPRGLASADNATAVIVLAYLKPASRALDWDWEVYHPCLISQ